MRPRRDSRRPGARSASSIVARRMVGEVTFAVIGLLFLLASRPADRPSPFTVAMPIAFCADLVLRAAFRTVPLVDVNPALAAPLVLVAALVFLAAGVAAMSGARTWTRPDFRGGLALIGLPALFLVAETGATNGAQVALASGLGLGPEPARATQLGMVLVGLGLAAGSLALSRRYPRGI